MEHIAKNIVANGGAAVADPSALRTAELAAEAAGVDYSMFEKEVNKLRNQSKQTSGQIAGDSEKDMNKMMMSNKQRKLYEKMKYSQRKREHEVRSWLYIMFWALNVLRCIQRESLTAKKRVIEKERKRKGQSSVAT